MATVKRKLALPALRGSFGKWVYYVCLMPAQEIAQRAHYATEVHESKELSDLIQRVLEGPRARKIARYLSDVDDRFFNSLVLATYGGDPTWFELTNLHTRIRGVRAPAIDEEKLGGVGFLELTGREQIFALDGQHRLAGIKQALEDGVDLTADAVPVILIGHSKSRAGMQRTRRLFTTLNKTAKPVKKSDIIALDEDDVMAITARRLVEQDPRFAPPKILVTGATSLPPTNQEALTNIVNLYDVLKVIFGAGRMRVDVLRFNRPSEQRLDEYYTKAQAYFNALSSSFAPVAELFRSTRPQSVTRKYRNAAGGHLLFRPIGLELFTKAAVRRSERTGVDLATSVKSLKHVPMDINQAPYVGVIWSGSRILTKGKRLAQQLMHYMAGNLAPEDVAKLLGEYREALENPKAALPPLSVAATKRPRARARN